MNLGDLHNVWETKALIRKPKRDEAQKILQRIAKQVQPIMRKHEWRVKLLSEFCPKNPRLLGLNVGSGIHVKLRLRRVNNDEEFLPFHEVLDTMLHELCHNRHGPHNASFYKLWDEIRKECEDLINKGISGSGEGFDLPGRRLGGASNKPSLSSLPRVALAAAENRARLGILLPSGPKKIGGDASIKNALTPVQAAAMAAERRLRDNIWCGSEFYDLSEEDETTINLSKDSSEGCCSEVSRTEFDKHEVKSRKRSRGSDSVLPSNRSINGGKQEPNFSSSCSSSTLILEKNVPIVDLSGEPSSPSSISYNGVNPTELCETWECISCTLLNPPLAPVCELCGTQKPKDLKQRNSIWPCKFCTLENDAKGDKCGACGAWRYSYGPPMAMPAPYLGT